MTDRSREPGPAERSTTPWGDRLRKALIVLGRRRPGKGDTAAQRATFRLMYERFREVLALNDSTLELIADIEEKLLGHRPFALDAVEAGVRRAAMDIFVMVKDLNQLARNRHVGLYDALRALNAELEALFGPPGAVEGPLVIPISTLRAVDAAIAGSKMANLGEVAGKCGLIAPPGFAITTAAVVRFLAAGELWERCERLEGVLELDGPEALPAACDEVRAAILAAPVPEDVAAAIRDAYAQCFPGGDTLVAVRSSAVGEDSLSSSHAGLYDTELNVAADRLLDAYRSVVASAFSATAVAYRFEKGLTAREALMAVGCVGMVVPRCAGIMYSRPPDDPEADAVVISTTPGLAARLAAGDENAEEIVAVPGAEVHVPSALLGPDELRRLVNVARCLEEHFGRPQDVEWAIDFEGRLTVLQSRPMVAIRMETSPAVDLFAGRDILLEGGFTACPGVGSGPVVMVDGEAALARFPEGGVLVAKHSSPSFAQVMWRCAAIVTDVGSPTGHMASLAREFGVPAVVGLDGATAALRPGRFVTVDATGRRIVEGALLTRAGGRTVKSPLADSPAVERLRAVARLVTPLRLTDPASPEFSPAGCRSLHDITRFVHEKVYEVMFHYGDVASEDRHHSARLDARLPLIIRVFDVGGGIVEEKSAARTVRPEDVTSVPMKAFLEGMLEPRIRWDLPRPVSMRGFLSVLGESMAGPPAEVRQVGRLSYAILSDRYVNFSTKAGYHFSTVDTYCGQSQNKNYIHFRFHGGAADVDRRERRVRCLSTILHALDFQVAVKGDLLTARLDKYTHDATRARLVDLGRLTMCARQLDMLMDDDSRPDFFAAAFLASEWEKF